jgi:hypothetical protein
MSEKPEAANRDQRAATRGSRVAVCAARAGLVLALALGFNVTIAAQNPPPGGGANNGSTGMQGSSRTGFGQHQGLDSLNNDVDYDPVMAERRVRVLNAERQKQMVADATKLLKLAKELNDEIAAANSGAFTPDQLHKIGEIEKLARNVKERMTAGVGQAPSMISPPNLAYPVH